MEDDKIALDKRLQQIIKTQPLQAKCVAYRTSTNVYRRLLKKCSENELKNLLNVQMAIEDVEIKLPKEDELPPPTVNVRKPTVESLLLECRDLDECLKLL